MGEATKLYGRGKGPGLEDAETLDLHPFMSDKVKTMVLSPYDLSYFADMQVVSET